MTLSGLLFAFLATGKCLAEVVLPVRPATRITELSTIDSSRTGYHWASGTGTGDGLNLLDIVLVASVDGKLHALNRNSGETVWSMAGGEGTAPATLAPLVRTQHPDIDPDLTDDDSDYQDVYVVEPQTGDIFIMSSPNSPLKRLPFSVPQLVDLSPFSFSSDDDKRLFIGKKETSLLLIELETGRVKATLNSECPWDPFQDMAEPAEFDIDLDELEGTKPPKLPSNPTEVYIGRTDYTVSIHTRPSRPSSTKPPIQKLSFSVYGPNNEDLALQALYRHTADNAYIQPLPSGEILSIKPSNSNTHNSEATHIPEMIWGRTFSTPIVAVLDVLRAPERRNPFVLLQPRLHLQEILPNADLQTPIMRNRLESAFVGMVEETGSLFAMSPSTYPMVVFGDAGVGRFLDSAPVVGDYDLPGDLDAVTRKAKERKMRKMCQDGSMDRRCLTGVHKLVSSSESRLSRLLDGVPTALEPPRTSAPGNNTRRVSNGAPDGDESPAIHRQMMVWDLQRDAPLGDDLPRLDPPLGDDLPKLYPISSVQAFSAFAVCALALLATLVWLGMRSKSSRRPVPPKVTRNPSEGSDNPDIDTSSIPVPGDYKLADVAEDVKVPGSDISRSPTPIPIPVSDSGRFVDTHEQIASDDLPGASQEGGADGDDSEKEGDTPATPGRRKGLRRKRGKKKKGGAAANGNGAVTDAEADRDGDLAPGSDNAQVPPPSTPIPVVPSLVVSDTILGFGSHGTVVFKGSLQGRAVAVKRLLQDFVTLASREVNILQESDDHPNVIRYYYQESQSNFLYIALELCPASLADIIERPDGHRDIVIAFDPKRALRQITAGLRHLHALKIVHRDIKPQNILISHAKKGIGETAGHRMLISDFGLCRKLEVDQTSFLPSANGAMAAGTVGWRAPEILRGEVKLDDATGDESQSSRGSVGSINGTPTGKPTRLTKSVDIFALGCLYYYVLTNGSHPFGDRYEREVNILKNAKCLDGLEHFGEEGSEGADLINRMLNPEAYDRPDTSTCLLHPYFWDPGKRLTFLQDASDRFEIMCRDPRDPNLIVLETGAFDVVGNDWHSRLDKLFIENLGKFRKYDGRSVQDLLRALRNKKHHYQDLPDNVKRLLGTMPEGFLAYFTRKFPHLFLHVHSVVSATSLRNESMFRTYFELTD
ncbi:hypothetical protein IEO21_08560 [Rhodonia placenta]|uniref:non-specific serine/threonine protein kinase n=1 Tax=Rhodonia placenta TaxID=104341 RepID=A0A8H7TYQ0_9APHY|nr:hypothetical protein IEO21_08560 [Postia placenta]